MEFSLFKTFEKVIKSAIQFAVAWFANLGLQTYGITIDPIVATGAIFAALEGLRNVLKQKFNIKWL